MSTVRTYVRLRLQEACGVVKAAATCARIGQTQGRVEIANGADDLVTAVERMLAEAAGHASSAGREQDRQGDSEGNPAPASFSSAEEAMDASETIRLLLHQVCKRLHGAAGIARAVEIRAKTSHPSAGIRLVLEVEPLLYDVKHFINTTSILNRMSNPSGRGE